MNKKYQLLNDFMMAPEFHNRIMINNITYKLGYYENQKSGLSVAIDFMQPSNLQETPPLAAPHRGLGSQHQRCNAVADQSDKHSA